MVDVGAVVALSTHRSVVESVGSGNFTPQSIPLAVLVFGVVILSELHSNRIDRFDLVLFLLGGSIFFFCSLFLPPVGESSDAYSTLSYGVLTFQLSTALATINSKRTSFFKILIVFFLVALTGLILGLIYTYSSDGTYRIGTKEDAAVVLGTSVYGEHRPTPMLKGRLDAALKIFKAGVVNRIVVTGAGQSEVENWYLRANGSRIQT